MEAKGFLEFDAFRVDLANRVLLRGGQVVSLPAKAFDVLLALLQKPGHTVSKDELMKAVWPDTFVEEGNLTQTVFILRKALGDSGGQSLIITVPRQGYRFTGNVTTTAQPEPAGTAKEQPPPAPVIAARRAALPWLAAGILAMIAGGASWFAWRALRPAQTFQPVPVTSYPGSESSPAFSPDGKQIAFVWDGEKGDNLDIYVTLVAGGGPPLRLTKDPGRDTAPAWSPDGSQIAFYRNNTVFLISPLGGAERRLVDVGLGINFGPFVHRPASLAWSPDGKWLVATDRMSKEYSPGATLINVSTGEKRYLTRPVPPGGSVGDTQYVFSPNGSRVVFVHWPPTAQGDLYEVPVSGGDVRSGTWVTL